MHNDVTAAGKTKSSARREVMQAAPPPPPLEGGLFVGRPSTSRLQLRPRTRSRRSHSRPGTAGGIPRASSVPLLSGDHVNLEVHSTPISLATRSLINQTTAIRVPSSTVTLEQQTHLKPVDNKTAKKSRPKLKTSATGRRGKIAAQFSSLRSEPEISGNFETSAPSCLEKGGGGGGGEGGGGGGGEKKIDDSNKVPLKMEGVTPVLNGSLEGATEREGWEEVEGKKREAAARQIQKWYRSCQRERQRARLDEVRNLLREKKTELDHSRSEQLNLSLREEKEREEKRRRRQEKMAASRQAAILSLQQKREERRKEEERIAQEEIALLQASEKIKRQGREKEKKRKKKKENVEREPEPKTTPSPIKKFPLRESPQTQSQPEVTASPVHTTSPVIPRNTSTYTDILDTLRLLEEAPPPLPGSESKETPPTNPGGKLGAAASSSLGVGVARETGPAPSSLSESKLHSILSYLEEVERTDEGKETTTSKTLSTDTTKQGSGGLGEELEAATAVASDVTSTILSQRMEIDNKNKTVEMLQKALSQQRELTVYHAREMEKEGERRMELQRQEYETTVQRHQTFIDQLIEDKKKLGEKCEKLVKELRETSTKYQTKVKNMEETHAGELAKVRQVAAAADKLRRERWRAEESQRIKEATVRSLEPEIQRIIQKGKADVQRLKAMHEAELLAADERAGRRFVAQMEELRSQCAAEKEQACAHERELARQRYEKLAEQEEMSSQQQRRRLFAELEQEREKMAGQWELQRQQLEHQLAESQESHGREVEELQREHSRQLEEVERRHGSQLRSLEERLTTERQAWQENYTRRQEAAFLTREREMRESLRQERDKEIEMVISRLEEEAEATRTQNERTADARIKRIRVKCEAELAEVERLERGTQEKLTSAKRELGEREGEVARLRSLLRQKEEEVKQVGEVAERLTRERDNVTDVVRQEFADRLVSTEEENRRLKLEMSELRARHKLEVERGQREKERELEEVHSRVRQALEKKEENLSALRSQHTAALRRAEHLEMLLERQRKELLKK